MRRWFLPVAVLVTALYWYLASLGLYPELAPWLNVGRLVLATALLALYAPTVRDLFRTKPYRDADYHITGLLLVMASIAGFAIFNELGRTLEIPTTIANSSVAGFFAMMVAGGSFFLFTAPRVRGPRVWWAVFIGVMTLMAIWITRFFIWFYTTPVSR